MSGTPKIGIDFAGWDVNIFDGDPKIDKLLDAQGWKGFGIYFFLCQMAYKFDGYFYRWGFDDCASTARRMGAGLTSVTVEETVRTCLQVGLFDNRLLEEWGILTSRGIQRRFLRAAEKRRRKIVISEYWLLDDAESGGLEKRTIKADLHPANEHLQTANADLLPANDPKGSKGSKGSKGDTGDALRPAPSRFEKPSVEEVSAYCKERGNNVDPQYWWDHYDANGWMVGKAPMKNWKATVRTWERNSYSSGRTQKTTAITQEPNPSFDYEQEALQRLQQRRDGR